MRSSRFFLSFLQETRSPVQQVEDDEGADPADESVGNGVSQWHEDHRDERRYALPHVVPVHVEHGLHHHHSDENQRRAHGPRGDRRQERGEEEGQEEVAGDGDGRHPRPTPFPHPGGGLDEGRHRGGAEERAHHDGGGVGHEGEVLALEIPLGVDEAGEARHGVEGPRGVQEVHVEESHDGLPEEGLPDPGEAQSPRRWLDLVHVHHLLEVVVGLVAAGVVGEGGDRRVAEPGDGGDEEDPVDHGPLDVPDQAVGNDDEPHHAEPQGGRLHPPAEAHDPAGDGGAGDEGDGAIGGGHHGGERDALAARAGAERDERGRVVRDEPHALVPLQADEGQEEPYPGGGGYADRLGHELGELGAEPHGGDEHEEEPLYEDRREGIAVGQVPGAVEAHHVVGEVGVDPHPRGQRDGEVGEDPHDQAPDDGGRNRRHDQISPCSVHAGGVSGVDDGGKLAGRGRVDAVGDGAGGAGVGEDGGVDGEDVRHGEESGRPRPQLRRERAPPLRHLEAPPDARLRHRGVEPPHHGAMPRSRSRTAREPGGGGIHL